VTTLEKFYKTKGRLKDFMPGGSIEKRGGERRADRNVEEKRRYIEMW